MRDLVILGAGGHAREQLDLVTAMNAVSSRFDVLGFLVDSEHRSGSADVRGLPILGDVDWLEGRVSEVDVVCALGKPAVRKRLAEQARRLGARFPTLVHPSARLTSTVRLGEGVVVAAGVVLTSDVVLADHVHVNVGATISHDCALGDHATLAPGVHLAGGVSVGEGAEIGVGASVSDHRSIGAWSIVGAGAAVVQDVPADSTAVGVPARVIAERSPGWQVEADASGVAEPRG